MRKISGAFGLALAIAAPGMVSAQAASEMAADQKGYIAYHYCMMQAAMKASYTDAKDEDIFGIAKSQCAATRSAVVVGQENNREFLAALDAADAEKAAHFPSWVKGVRERRSKFESTPTNNAPVAGAASPIAGH
jgi:hypothetical protein